MADNREYISQEEELGSIHIAGEVLAVIAAAAAMEVEGVSALSPHLSADLTEVSGKKILARGVRLHVDSGLVTVEVSILVKYGYIVPEVARQVQQAVLSTLVGTSGLSVQSVNIHVAGMAFPKEKK